MFSTASLCKFAAVGGVACVAIASTYQMQMTARIKNKSYYKTALAILNEHQASDKYLGKPIKTGYVDVLSSKNYADVNNVNLFVPVKGSKTTGELFFKAENINDNWVVNRIELELKDNLGGKLLIYDSSRN